MLINHLIPIDLAGAGVSVANAGASQIGSVNPSYPLLHKNSASNLGIRYTGTHVFIRRDNEKQ